MGSAQLGMWNQPSECNVKYQFNGSELKKFSEYSCRHIFQGLVFKLCSEHGGFLILSSSEREQRKGCSGTFQFNSAGLRQGNGSS